MNNDKRNNKKIEELLNKTGEIEYYLSTGFDGKESLRLELMGHLLDAKESLGKMINRGKNEGFLRAAITKADARRRGYHSFTQPYAIPQELWMLKNVRRDLQKSNVTFAIVATNAGFEVWKKQINIEL